MLTKFGMKVQLNMLMNNINWVFFVFVLVLFQPFLTDFWTAGQILKRNLVSGYVIAQETLERFQPFLTYFWMIEGDAWQPSILYIYRPGENAS